MKITGKQMIILYLIFFLIGGIGLSMIFMLKYDILIKEKSYDLVSDTDKFSVQYDWHDYDEGTLRMTKPEMEKVFFSYIQNLSQIEDEKYIRKVVEGYSYLMETVSDDKQSVLFFMALCGVESHFKMTSKSSVGAIGISQVMYSVHNQYIKELGINKENFFNSPKHNILAGYMIWKSYWKSSDKNYRVSCYKYLGVQSDKYYHKVIDNYFQLMNLMMKQMLNVKEGWS